VVVGQPADLAGRPELEWQNECDSAGICGLSGESVISQNINDACNDSTGIREICISLSVPLVSFVSSNPVATRSELRRLFE